MNKLKTMTDFILSVIWIFLNIAFFIVRGDTDIFCQFGQSCMLSCTFQPGDDAVIHWIQVTPENPNLQVHSYYYNKDQLGLQNERFQGRTLLFTDQISRGNASLKLNGIKIQDEGRYKCYTSTISGNKESFILLKVNVPVQTVKIEKKNNTLTCKSDEIYPEPDLTWEPSPSSPPPETKKGRTEKGLYNISSSVTLSDADTDLDYSCTVSTSKNKKKVTLMKQASMSSSDTEVIIYCGASDSSPKSLIWRFNETQLILTRRTPEDPYVASEKWKKYVKSVSNAGSLTLKDLTSKENGVYTCELRNTEEIFLKHTALRCTDSSEHKIEIIIPVVISGIILLVIIVALVLWMKKRNRGKGRKNQNNHDEEMKVNGVKERNGKPIEVENLL